MDAKTILEKHKKVIWPVIEKYLHTPLLPKAFIIPPKYKKDEQFYWQVTREYPQRQGKYLRPTLVCLTAQAMGVPVKKTLLTAAGMQVSEDWLLVHDDWEDNSTKRRGKPALHRLYSPETAINAGDALHNTMWKIFADNRKMLGEKTTFEILDEFYTQLSRTTIGQMTEINWMQTNKLTFTDTDWFFIADGKTSYYTIACPMRLGAIIAGATSKQLDQLAEFGVVLGRCFQLVDDLLDVTSDFSGLKEYANDIYEGKRTVILGHLLRHLNPINKKKLKTILAKNRDAKTKSEVDWVIAQMHESGSIDYAKAMAKDLKDQAMDLFETKLTFLSHEPARSELKTLITFILERDH